MEKGKGKKKGKVRWNNYRVRKVGRTDAQTLR